MNLKEKELKRKIIIKRRNIKKKLELLKQGEIVQENAYSPITKHLAAIASDIKNNSYINNNHNNTNISSKSDNSLNDQNINNTITTTTSEKNIPTLQITSSPKKKRKLQNTFVEDFYDYDNDDISSIKQSMIDESSSNSKHSERRFIDLEETSFRDYLEQYDPLPRKYISKMYTSEKNQLDCKYGIRMGEHEKFYIGDSQVYIDGSDIVLKNKKYKGTTGLYELLFKKNPNNYTQDDVINYQQIVARTNAHRRYYQSNKQVEGSKLTKYKNVIAPISGTGISSTPMYMEVNDNKIDYIFWDDPNELVSRLKLLVASKQAGHTGHGNEINSLLEELREAEIIL